jgi:hypothetical protein
MPHRVELRVRLFRTLLEGAFVFDFDVLQAQHNMDGLGMDRGKRLLGGTEISLMMAIGGVASGFLHNIAPTVGLRFRV